MPKLFHQFKLALDNNNFTVLDRLIEDNYLGQHLHLDNNYLLQQVVQKGLYSYVKKLLTLNNVWWTFDEDVLLQANQYTKHKGIQRLLENTAFQRFKHALSKAVSEDALAFVTQNFDDSQFISAHAAQEQNSLLKLAINKGAYTLVTKLLQNNEVYDQCGLNELYLALRTSSHPGIIRKLLTIPQIHKTLLTFGDLETIEIALNSVADAEDAKMIWSTVVKRPIGQLESIDAPRTVDDLEINNHVLADKSLLSELPEKLFCLQDMNEAVAFAIEHEDEEYSDVASEEANLLIPSEDLENEETLEATTEEDNLSSSVVDPSPYRWVNRMRSSSAPLFFTRVSRCPARDELDLANERQQRRLN